MQILYEVKDKCISQSDQGYESLIDIFYRKYLRVFYSGKRNYLDG